MTITVFDLILITTSILITTIICLGDKYPIFIRICEDDLYLTTCIKKKKYIVCQSMIMKYNLAMFIIFTCVLLNTCSWLIYLAFNNINNLCEYINTVSTAFLPFSLSFTYLRKKILTNILELPESNIISASKSRDTYMQLCKKYPYIIHTNFTLAILKQNLEWEMGFEDIIVDKPPKP